MRHFAFWRALVKAGILTTLTALLPWRFNATSGSTFRWPASEKWWADGTGSSLISQHSRASKRRAGLNSWNEFLWEQLINSVSHIEWKRQDKRAACDTMVTLLCHTRSFFYAAVEGVSSDSGQNVPLQSLIWGRVFSLIFFFFFFTNGYHSIQHNDKKYVVVKAVPSTLEEPFINHLTTWMSWRRSEVGLRICVVKNCWELRQEGIWGKSGLLKAFRTHEWLYSKHRRKMAEPHPFKIVFLVV